jgi:hypothetical protein
LVLSMLLPPWLVAPVEPVRVMLPAAPWPDLEPGWQPAGNCGVDRQSWG